MYIQKYFRDRRELYMAIMHKGYDLELLKE